MNLGDSSGVGSCWPISPKWDRQTCSVTCWASHRKQTRNHLRKTRGRVFTFHICTAESWTCSPSPRGPRPHFSIPVFPFGPAVRGPAVPFSFSFSGSVVRGPAPFPRALRLLRAKSSRLLRLLAANPISQFLISHGYAGRHRRVAWRLYHDRRLDGPLSEMRRQK
jgi:hypothetical protein